MQRKKFFEPTTSMKWTLLALIQHKNLMSVVPLSGISLFASGCNFVEIMFYMPSHVIKKTQWEKILRVKKQLKRKMLEKWSSENIFRWINVKSQGKNVRNEKVHWIFQRNIGVKAKICFFFQLKLLIRVCEISDGFKR